MYFPNSKQAIQPWIVVAEDIFDRIILINDIPISDMSPFQNSTLFREIYKANIQYRRVFLSRLNNVDFIELGEGTIQNFNVPHLEYFINDLFQIKTSTFYTRALILVHSNIVSQCSHFIFFSRWNSVRNDPVFELCRGLSSFEISYSCWLNRLTVLYILFFLVLSFIKISVFTSS